MIHFLGIAQTIVSALGGLYETILVGLFGMIWLAYRFMRRQKNPRLGIFRYLIWLPLAFCFYGIYDFNVEYSEVIGWLTEAGALTDEQRLLFLSQSIRGTSQMFAIGIVGTLFLLWTTRRPKSTAPSSLDGDSLTSTREKEHAEPVHLVEPSMGHGNT